MKKKKPIPVILENRSARTVFSFFCTVIIMALFNRFSEGGEFRERMRERVKDRIEKRLENKDKGTKGSFPRIEGQGTTYKESPYGAGDYRRYVSYGGRERFYELHVPEGYIKDRPSALVLNFHGGGGNPSQERNDSQMDRVSEIGNFIVVYPAGTGKFQERFLTFNAGICCGYAKENEVDDVGFTMAVLDDVAKFFHIDQRRVYATGFSNGAFLCYRLAFELSNRIAAIAPVSGVIGIDRFKYTPSRPVPLVHFHGLKDMNVVYQGGVGPKAQEKIHRLSVAESIDYWVEYNGCVEDKAKEMRKGMAVRKVYSSGKEGAEVVLWTLEDGGHAWPGGKSSLPEQMVGRLNKDINASELIWEFFQAHTL